MRSQLHAGQLRYHDFPKLRELHRLRTIGSVSTGIQPSIIGPSYNALQQQNRTFLSMLLNNDRVTNLRLKQLERDANQNPQLVDMQYDFVSELVQKYPSIAVERYQMTEFAMDERLAVLYLSAMQQTNNVNAFHMEKFLSRLQTHDAVRRDALHELALDKTLSKPQQISRVLGVLSSGPGALATGAMAGLGGTAMAGGAMARGVDPKSPLFVQLNSSGSLRNAAFTLARQVIVAFVVVSALTALLDEKALGRAVGMGNNKHIQESEGTDIRFSDVKGVAEAKAELEEIVEYLRDPSKFTRLGGKLPRGILLTGPPGTGKTLLAKAIAGEAGVPFYFSSGSQFEEVYVGLGAKRIRELFEAAKKKAPAIIFIDEIDAVGGTRKLKDQSALKMTLNELLVQLDGFDENNGIIVIGATNFMESLDTALLRPGRFDKHVTVPLPDVGGRKEILELYSKKTKLSKDVDLSVVARGTVGFSGADLFNLMNQAAIKASVEGLDSVNMSVIEYAKDKIIMGAERKTAVITAKTARCTAFHEAGHALVAVLTEGASPIHKATIMPRGQALGMVTMLPDGDQTSQSYKEMIASMDVAMGGRVAEELIFGADNVTSGAVSDIQYATRIARALVTKYGFSKNIGFVYHGGNTGEESASAETRAQIDEEVKKLTDEAYQRAKDLINSHSKAHHLLAESLLEYETLTGEEVRAIIKNGSKPKRSVVNKDKGQRGDQSVLKGKNSTSSGPEPREPIKGWGFGRRES